MIRTVLLALAASLLPCASFAQVATPMITIATPLKANSGDQNIKLSSARGPFKKGAVIKLCPATDATPAFSYVAKAAACPTPVVVTEPAPAPPAPSILTALSVGEAFAQTDLATFGWNAGGGLGTFNDAPAGYRADLATLGRARVGLFHPPLDDVLLQGRVIEGFFVTANNLPRRGNLRLTGFAQIPGGFVDPLTWSGATPEGIAIDQTAAVSGAALGYTVTLTNRTGKALSGLTYVRSVDPDQSDLYNTTNKVVAPGVVEAKLQGKGGTFFLGSADPRARIAIAPYNKSADVGTPRAVGQSRSADEVLQLVFDLGDLAPGAAVTVRFDMGVKR